MGSTFPDRVAASLAATDFPATKPELLADAASAGAAPEVLDALRGLPVEEYRNMSEVLASVPVNLGELNGQGRSEKPLQARERKTGVAEHNREVGPR